MSTGLVGSIILWLIVAIIAIVVVVYLLNWLYHRSTREVAFVRTGFGGEKVVISGGAFVLPILHEVTPVNLNVVRIPVTRAREEAISTRDRMRVDVEAEFFVRVMQERQAVSAAASTLGRRTMDRDGLSELLSGKFIGALRSVAAEMSIDEMHEQREDMVARVEERARTALAQNGLELESVAITDLDQTNLEYFNPANRFDAEGMTQLIEAIEARRKLRNDIEQASMVAIRTRNLEAEKETLKLEQESESSRLSQERELEDMRAEQRAAIQRSRVTREAESEQWRISSEQETREREIARQRALEAAEIAAREETEKARIAHEQALEAARLEREHQIRTQQIKQKHDIDHSEIASNEDVERSRIVSERQLREARIIADEETETREIAKGQQVETTKLSSQKAIESARIEQEKALDKARIERDRLLRSQQIAQRQSVEEAEISANEEIERARIASERGLDEVRILKERDLKRLEVERDMALELAQIERQISVLQKQSEEAEARASTEAERVKAVEAEENVNTRRETVIAERIAAVDRLLAEKDADTTRIAAEAEKISAAVAAEAQRLRNEADNILSEDARAGALRSKMIDRLENIVRESVKPMENIEGIKILHVDGLGGNGQGGHRSPTDEVIESALRYRAQAPLIDEMMKEIGVEGSKVAGMGDIFRSAKDAQSLAQSTEKAGQSDKKSGTKSGKQSETQSDE
ncbi:MAG TPA: flotillin domain-containing protein [Arenicellales bacterium]|nr:flotillin domain-containing protein [Arenicellales bacterium]